MRSELVETANGRGVLDAGVAGGTVADQTTGIKESACRVQATLTPQTEPI